MRVGAAALPALLALLALAAATPPPPPQHHINHIKANILAKLGLTERPTAVGAPPRDVVRQILARAADPEPAEPPHQDMREIIAIAHRVPLQWMLLKSNDFGTPPTRHNAT